MANVKLKPLHVNPIMTRLRACNGGGWSEQLGSWMLMINNLLVGVPGQNLCCLTPHATLFGMIGEPANHKFQT